MALNSVGERFDVAMVEQKKASHADDDDKGKEEDENDRMACSRTGGIPKLYHLCMQISQKLFQVLEDEPCGSSSDWSCEKQVDGIGESNPANLMEYFFGARRHADEAVPFLPRMQPPTWKYAAHGHRSSSCIEVDV
ncbi:hypothetical protein GCK32_012240 [Trichostrongylus colubriformis]|uniref:Uncharacterized protein n=1 Tax=Trichostrongylus colubriformis TaxID=6319 RepID=A0AAN8EQ18_TRICO